MAIADGLYEIRSTLLTSMCVAVASSSSARGANVLLYSETGSNGQKFQITEVTTGKWSMVSAASGQYVAVANSSATDGANVIQWSSTGGNGQRWKITETGSTVTIDGVSCSVVTIGSYVTGDGSTYMLDVNNAMTTNSTNIQIGTASSTDAQEFALMPTTMLDQALPTPAGISWATAVGGDGRASQPEAAKLYPTWTFTEAWGDLSTRGFEFSYCTRTIPDDGASPGAWSSWTAWSAASVTTSGAQAWLTAGISGSVPAGDKSLEVAFRVRPTATIGGTAYHGQTSAATLTAQVVPTVAATAVTMGADAMAVTLTSDYAGGTTTAIITSIQDGDGTEWLAEPVTASGTGGTISASIPPTSLAGVPDPADAATLAVEFTVGTDQYAPSVAQATASAPYAWATSDSLSPAPSLAYASDAVARATVSAGTTRRAWMYAGGAGTELDQDPDGKIVIPYPFGEACELYVTAKSSTAWGHSLTTISADAAGKVAPCHAWSWPGGTLVLYGSAGDMETSRSIRATAETFELLARPWQTVTFAETLQGTARAVGVIDASGPSTVADLEALARAHRALYRAPSGETFAAAITGVEYESRPTITTASVTMTQEAPS